MKTFGIAAAYAALFWSVLLVPVASEAQNASAPGIPGYLDPKSGVFKPVVATAAPAATLTRKGTITVTVTVQIDPSIPAGQLISCGVGIGSSDFPGISNSASSGSAVVRAGSSGKCTTVIPYVWIVANAATMMNVSVGVATGIDEIGLVSRSANTSFPAFPVPNGNKSLSVTVAL